MPLEGAGEQDREGATSVVAGNLHVEGDGAERWSVLCMRPCEQSDCKPQCKMYIFLKKHLS